MLAALFLLILPFFPLNAHAEEQAPASTAALRGVHFTGWAAGSTKARRRFLGEMKAAGFNAVVVALKDSDGHEFVPGVPFARKTGAYMKAIPDLPGAVKDFKDQGIYMIARIAVFKDDHLARARPDLAVHFPDGSLWVGDKGVAWADPYRREVWDYVIDVASRAAGAGFDEIQFDYIRFPSDGKTRLCRYSKEHTPATASGALRDFLTLARERLKPLGVKISIDTFGLTTSVDNGMGIGQQLDQMADLVDYVSPMMYPSHYAKGEYGLKNPNKQPYLTVHHGIEDALTRVKDPAKLRPFLQDFSLGVRYTPAHVRAQIRAAEELGVRGWILWNPGNHYTWSAVQAGPIVKPSPEESSPKAPSKPRRKAEPADAESEEPAPLPDTPPAAPKPEDKGSDSFAPAPATPEATPTPEVH